MSMYNWRWILCRFVQTKVRSNRCHSRCGFGLLSQFTISVSRSGSERSGSFIFNEIEADWYWRAPRMKLNVMDPRNMLIVIQIQLCRSDRGMWLLSTDKDIITCQTISEHESHCGFVCCSTTIRGISPDYAIALMWQRDKFVWDRLTYVKWYDTTDLFAPTAISRVV